MQKIHFISIQEPLMLESALAIKERGYQVTVSGIGVTEDQVQRLLDVKIPFYGDGWQESWIVKDLSFVIVGNKVEQDNPEFLLAKERGLLLLSLPEFFYLMTKEKTRLLVAGSRGKKGILSLIAKALKNNKLNFNFASHTTWNESSKLIEIDYQSRIALFEGSKELITGIDKTYHPEIYRPHILVIGELNDGLSKLGLSQEEYKALYKNLIDDIERQGKFIYYVGNTLLQELAEDIREDITAIAYESHPLTIDSNGIISLETRYGLFNMDLSDEYLIQNINAARLACRQLGISDRAFYESIATKSDAQGQ